MTKTFKAEYDAEHQTLQLLEPLEGVGDGQRVDVIVSPEASPDPNWWKFCGVLSGENGESFAQAIDEAFPIGR